VCKFGRDPAIFLVEEAIYAKCLQTDRQMDGRRTPHDCISSWNELKNKIMTVIMHFKPQLRISWPLVKSRYADLRIC